VHTPSPEPKPTPKPTPTPTPSNELPGSAALKKGMTAAEYAEAYRVATEIVNRHKEKDEIEMLAGIVGDVFNIYLSGTHSESEAHYNNVYGALILKRASCAGVTRAVNLCMTILGIPYEHVNENQWTHQWCRIFVKSENSYWVLDGQAGIIGPEPSPYEHPGLVFFDIAWGDEW
jgi:hypothetical protein